MSTIHLWDNSWHVSEPTEGQKDSFGRESKSLKRNGRDDICLRALSSSTIGELIADEECEVLVWPNSINEGYDELKDQYIFRITEKDGKTIDSLTTNNVVGFIGKGNTDIRIHSRFASSYDNDFFLYYMLEKVMAINSFSLSSAGKEPEEFDFLLFFFPRLLKDALSQGMYKKYVYHEYNDANIRGVVDVNRHIRLNIPANGKIAYRTREFSYDNSVTQLIRHTIEFIHRKQFGKAVLHNDPDTEGCVQQIIQATPTFQPQQRQAIINENLRPVVHPYYTKYAALQNLCLRILRYEKLSYGNDSNNKIHGLLIDAAWLWEEYIGQVLSEDTDIKHYTRKNSHYHLFRDKDEAFQKIIPDYYDGDRIVADAKYIPLNRSRDLDADRAAPIYYKTIMYMYRFNTEKGFLFHPVAQGEAVGQQVLIDTYDIEGREGCKLHKVGMVVPEISDDDYVIFKNEKMKEEENEFVKSIKKAANL
jgi:5-methylcytosine-specific restriction endonuclease McrBC regulatory subunit McrC